MTLIDAILDLCHQVTLLAKVFFFHVTTRLPFR
jgi:hypothetical protein